jgi:hypothetical protein
LLGGVFYDRCHIFGRFYHRIIRRLFLNLTRLWSAHKGKVYSGLNLVFATPLIIAFAFALTFTASTIAVTIALGISVRIAITPLLRRTFVTSPPQRWSRLCRRPIDG